ncbi:MAG: cytochrome C oxidase subunit II [Myxococcota bacterium]
MIESLVPAASSYAADMDNLFTLIFVIVAFWFILCEGLFFWLIWRFRKKEGVRGQYVTGELKSEKRWITYPHLLVLVCDLFIVAGAVKVWYDVKQYLPPADETVRIVSQQWAWTFVHAGPDGVLGTTDDITKVNELHVEVDKTYHYKLESTDVLHSFSVPVFRLKQDAIPGRVITGWFKPILAGEWDIQCAEICGIGHGLMAARIYIETPEQHAAWLMQESPISYAAIATVTGSRPAEE